MQRTKRDDRGRLLCWEKKTKSKKGKSRKNVFLSFFFLSTTFNQRIMPGNSQEKSHKSHSCCILNAIVLHFYSPTHFAQPATFSVRPDQFSHSTPAPSSSQQQHQKFSAVANEEI